MTYTKASVQEFLTTVHPFNQLSENALTYLTDRIQLLRYRMGQAVLVRDKLPAQVSILYEGQIRLLGYDPRTQRPITLQLLRPGAILGWIGLMRGVPCETAIASNETICLTLSAADFLALLDREPQLALQFRQQCPLIEIFDLLGAELHRQAIGDADLKEVALRAEANAVVCNLPPGRTPLGQLEQDRIWLVSGGEITHCPVGSRLNVNTKSVEVGAFLEVTSDRPARVIGFPHSVTENVAIMAPEAETPLTIEPVENEIPYAPDRPPEIDPRLQPTNLNQAPPKYPFVKGKGQPEVALACFQMFCQYFNMPFRKDIVRRVLTNQLQRGGGISLELCGAVSEMMGLHAQLVTVPASAISRLEAPVLVVWQDSLAILYSINERELLIAV
ncbi:MAG TPA: cyclic nucleotide-binding domain-containing protein, partial [Allocoleopsis sp.]